MTHTMWIKQVVYFLFWVLWESRSNLNIITSLECDNDVDKILGRGSPEHEITVGYLAF